MEKTFSQTPEDGNAGSEINPAKEQGVFKRALVSVSFVEKAVLLLLTALITGLLIPYVSSKIQTTNAHNEIVLQAKAKLLDDVTNTLVTYQYLVGDVSYYKSDSSLLSEKMQSLAFERYSTRVVELVSQWGVEIAKARTLASPEISDKLNKFMDKVLEKQDAQLVRLFNNKGSVKEWADLNDLNGNMYEEAKKLIDELAVDFKITTASAK